ncbi:MAG: M20/M25/M40 family metallo-hydrolase [Acidimicrobiia bacterium]|nr:M20/M25/M40 family metallo-hydrolase [Acidimicrobiia bacterium]
MFDPVAVLQDLVRLDTTNPPGNEAAAVSMLQGIIETAGVEMTVLSRDPERPNLIARIPGRGEAPALLMQGHVDVVTTADQAWAHDPFGGEIIDGFLWGRGTLDMKGAVVMMVHAFVRLALSDSPPAGDVVLAVLSDEENSGYFGAKYLVENHPEHFADVKYCIGEFGGFPMPIGGTRFYPIQVAERLSVRFELAITAEGGHGSLPRRGAAMARLGKTLTALERKRMPVHISAATRLMVEGMVEHTTGITQRALRLLLNERTADAAFRLLPGQLGVLEPVFRNTVSPTIVRGGKKHNVVPAEIRLTLDGRMVPSSNPEEMAAELRRIVGPDVDVGYAVDGKLGPREPDMGLFPLLADVVKRRDPDGVPIPFLMPAATDGRWFAELGIQPYGFTPLLLPDGFAFQELAHAADERIPVAALEPGADMMFDMLNEYRGQ